MPKINNALQKIKELAESSDENVQKEMCDILLTKLLPNHKGDDGDKINAQLVIEAGSIPNLINFLSSKESEVIRQASMCLSFLAYHFPKIVVENQAIPPLIKCLKLEDDEVCWAAAQGPAHCLTNILWKCNENVAHVIAAGGHEALVDLLSSNDMDVIQQALHALNNLSSYNSQTTQYLLDYEVLNSIKKLFTPNPYLRLLLTTFIKNVAAFEEAHVDMIIDIIPIIVKQIKFKLCDEVRIESIEVIKNVIRHKPEYIPTLIQNSVISSIVDNFQSDNIELFCIALSSLKDVIAAGRSKIHLIFEQCGGLKKLKKLLEHENEEVKKLAKNIHQQLADKNVEHQATKAVKTDSSKNDDKAVAQSNPRKRKPPSNSDDTDEEEEEYPSSKRDYVLKWLNKNSKLI